MQKITVRNVTTLRAVASLLSLGVFVGGCASPTSTTRQTPIRQTTEAAPVRPAPSADVLERVLAEATGKGIEVIHNATVVPSGAYGPGQITMPAGTEYDGFAPDGAHFYYKNKADTLTTAGTPEGIRFISGKGAIRHGNKLYCFGF